MHLYCEVIGILTITTAGSYQFRLTAEDGARLEIDGSQVINHSSGIQSVPQVVTSSALRQQAVYTPSKSPAVYMQQNVATRPPIRS